MKKYLLIVFCALLLVAVTGCGKKQIKCTNSTTESGVEINAEVIADLDDSDKVTDATVIYGFSDSSIVDQYCSIFKMAEDEEKGISVDCSGSKITIKGMASLDDDEEDNVIGQSKDEFVKSAEEEGFTCK